MNTTIARAREIVKTLSTQEKIRLISGRDFWTTEPLEDHGVPSIWLSDGPHGLRKQEEGSDHLGLDGSVPATCFPTAAALGSSWDPNLAHQVGVALGQEARDQGLAVILGPGLNIKRHAAGGRSFEYLSEDPFVSGKLAAGLVRGIQSQGVGACLKHYAANNQESRRLVIDALVDERTLREIYLTGFEIAVKESSPWTIMSSYNKVNGEHVGESPRLIADVLRGEWGFDGLVMTDWMATSDRAAGLRAGLDLEMPGSSGLWDAEVEQALAAGEVTEAQLDRAARRVIALALLAQDSLETVAVEPADYSANHQLARIAAAAGSVLLKNEGLLPLQASGTIALIGAFAEHPRYQGAGSSQVNVTRLDNARAELTSLLDGKAVLTYAAGYDPATGETTPELLAEAREVAAAADVAIVMVGLPSSAESEGFDRPHLQLPAGHNTLVETVATANSATAVVLQNGAPVELPWVDSVQAILEAYLGGQAGGGAIADILLGVQEPGGRLAESFPVRKSDVASDLNFPGDGHSVQYREGLYVGYRFHDSAGVDPLFAFGHGLSYTTFEYSGFTVSGSGTEFVASFTVTNTGDRHGSTVAQLYVRDNESTIKRPWQELKGFSKVALSPGESAEVSLPLHHRSFATYDVTAKAWRVESGTFTIALGDSSRDIRAEQTIEVESPDQAATTQEPRGFVATEEEFAALLGHALPVAPTVPVFSRDTTIMDLQQTRLGRRIQAAFLTIIGGMFGADSAADSAGTAEALQSSDASPSGPDPLQAMLGETPLRSLAMASGGQLSLEYVDRMATALNRTAHVK